MIISIKTKNLVLGLPRCQQGSASDPDGADDHADPEGVLQSAGEGGAPQVQVSGWYQPIDYR